MATNADQDETGYIYTLNDPRTGDPRYVGATISPDKRLYEHQKCGRSSGQAIHEWVEELESEGETPDLNIVREVPVEEMPKWERETYNDLSDEFELLNVRIPRYESDVHGEPAAHLLKSDMDILDVFKEGKSQGEPWGYANPALLKSELDYHANTIYNRTQKLVEWGHIDVIDEGTRLFKLVSDPRDVDSESSSTLQDYL